MTTGRINQISIGCGGEARRTGAQHASPTLMIVCCIRLTFGVNVSTRSPAHALASTCCSMTSFLAEIPQNAATIKYRFLFNQASAANARQRTQSSARAGPGMPCHGARALERGVPGIVASAAGSARGRLQQRGSEAFRTTAETRTPLGLGAHTGA